MDCRGQGGLSQNVGIPCGSTFKGHILRGIRCEDPSYLLYRDIYLDAAQMVRIVMSMPEVDEKRVGAFGGSQGGGLTLACAALTPGLNRAAAQFPFLCDFKRSWEHGCANCTTSELREYFRRFDPRHQYENDLFTRLGNIDNQHLAHRIRAEVLMLTGLLDQEGLPEMQFAAYNQIASSKQVLIYPDHGHEELPEGDNEIIQFFVKMEG